MSVGKPRGREGKRPVWVYDRRARRKVYVGQADSLKAARRLEALKDDEINGQHQSVRGWTVDRFAQHFLDAYHGENTTRPEPTTRMHNEHGLRRFRGEHGHRRLGDYTRDEAHEWAAKHPHEAKVLSAMFNEAVDKHGLPANPFRGLGHKSRGRADITPLTEREVEQLATVAERSNGLWGATFAAYIRFSAWTGLGTGEMCGLEWAEIDLARRVVFVEWIRRNDGSRAKAKKRTKRKRVVPLSDGALEALRRLPREGPAVFTTPTGQPIRPNAVRHYWHPVRATFEDGLPQDHWLTRRLRHNPNDHLDPYELRHFFGSYLADQGLSSRDIAEVMGNSVRVCEEVYIHAHEDRVQERVRQALDRRVTELRPVDDTQEAAG